MNMREFEKIKVARFHVLSQREDNWDDCNSKKPTKRTLEHAQHIIEQFADTAVANGHELRTPFISTDEDGHVTIQWNKKPRELHLNISEKDSWYLKVSGPNINTDMEEGVLNPYQYRMLSEWLTQ